MPEGLELIALEIDVSAERLPYSGVWREKNHETRYFSRGRYEHEYDLIRDCFPGEYNYLPVEQLKLGVRARKALNHFKIETAGELVAKSAKEILRLRGFGVRSLKQITDALYRLSCSSTHEFNCGELSSDRQEEIDRNFLIAKLAGQGLTRREIAKKTGIWYGSICRIAKSEGINIKRELRSSKVDTNKLINLVEEGQTLRYMGEQLGVCRERVRQIISGTFVPDEYGRDVCLYNLWRRSAQSRK